MVIILGNTCLSISFLFLLRIPSAFALYFNLSPITPSHVNSFINIEGDAYISNQGIQVTTDERNTVRGDKIGRATYVKPLHLWDKASGNLTDFKTEFSLVIDSAGSDFSADGLAFFLAPVGSSIPNGSHGGGLGLQSGDWAVINNTALSFVAVEFDTFRNALDPATTHVGININSMKSVTTVAWRNNLTQGTENNASISYNATSRDLRVTFTGFEDNTNRTQEGSLNYTVDLRDYLPEWVIFGFSAATGVWFEKNNVKSWMFNSSLEIDVASQEPIPSPNPTPNSMANGRKRKNTGLVIGLSAGLSVLIVGLALLGYALWMKRKKEKDYFLDQFNMDNEFEKGSGPKKFSYNELARATNNFAEGEKLGEGGFGGVYKGFLRDGNSYVAVKKVSKGSMQGLKEYAAEVKIISQLRHRNLVQLIGWCHERGELLLVYEFMPNGSLDAHLFKQKSLLTWGMRYKIAQGLASALLYLQEEWEKCVVHRDIKSSNIMLDLNFNAKLGDFGLARLVDHEKGSQTTVLAGTMGYMAPECVITGRASKESDVYSFGIVALEIACGRRPINVKAEEDQVRTVEYIWDQYGCGRLLEAADPKLCADFDVQEMERLMVVALWCAHPDCNLRPSMRQAIHVLNFEAELPILPSKMPLPTYLAPPPNSFPSNSFQISKSNQLQSSSFFNSGSSNFTSSSAASSPSVSLLHTR